MIDIEKLINIYTNEKSTKLLLPYNNIIEEFNDYLKQYILAQQNSEDPQIIKAIKEIEIERVGYFIKEYIQCRFDKIKKNLYLDTSFMSKGEQIFYKKFLELIKKKGIYQENEPSMVENVGFVANKNIDSVKIDDDVVKI